MQIDKRKYVVGERTGGMIRSRGMQELLYRSPNASFFIFCAYLFTNGQAEHDHDQNQFLTSHTQLKAIHGDLFVTAPRSQLYRILSPQDFRALRRDK